MKSIATIMKKAAFLPVICVSFLCFGQPAMNATGDDEKGKVEFIKSENGNLFFDVDLKNIPATGCIISISNQEDQLLFEGQIKTNEYRKTFKIPNDGTAKIYFAVNGKKYRISQSFDLKYKVETKWEVTKL